MLEILMDALIDALKLLPILLPMYILIEIIEKRGLKYFLKPLRSRWSVVAAAAIGIIPQCGFSVVASKLYAKKLIPLGALVAIFICASDEAVPILISQPLKLLPLLGIKIAMAILAGLFIGAMARICASRSRLKLPQNNASDNQSHHAQNHPQVNPQIQTTSQTTSQATSQTASQNNTNPQVHPQTNPQNHAQNQNVHAKIHHKNQNVAHLDPINNNETSKIHHGASADDCPADEFCSFGCHNHEIGACQKHHHKRSLFANYLLHPLLHTATVFALILLVNAIFGTIVHAVGEQRLTDFMQSTGAAQPLLAAIIGLIPNCASSVAISQMYSIGQLGLGAAVAGLSVNAGVAYVVLIKERRNTLHCLKIVGAIFLFSVAAGTLVHIIAATF